MTCSDCKNSSERLWHGFTSGCKGCQARAIGRGPLFHQAKSCGRITSDYRALLVHFNLTHEQIKAAHKADALGEVHQ